MIKINKGKRFPKRTKSLRMTVDMLESLQKSRAYNYVMRFFVSKYSQVGTQKDIGQKLRFWHNFAVTTAKCSACCLFCALSHGQTKTALRCFFGDSKKYLRKLFGERKNQALRRYKLHLAIFSP